MNQVTVTDKTVMVTGGGGGLGRALAKLVLARGGKVFLCDVNGEALEEAKKELEGGGRVEGAVCDVTKGDEWEKVWRDCGEKMGVPDVLVNNAVIVGEGDWERIYDINVKGVHQGILLAHKFMSTESGGVGGVVVNVSSTMGVTCTGEMFAIPAYTASKHAVTALTRTFGHEFWSSRHGVSVVGVAPYFIENPLFDDFDNWTPDPGCREALRKSAEGKKFLTPDEAALKIFDVFNATSGSIWLIRPGMMPPFNVPDYKLPQPKLP